METGIDPTSIDKVQEPPMYVTQEERKAVRDKDKGRISGAEMLHRLRVVEQAIIDGKRGGEIVQHLEEEHKITVAYNTVKKYMARVRDKWESEDAVLRPIWRQRQLTKLHQVALKMENSKAWGPWVSCQRLIADVEGNLQPVKVQQMEADPFEGWTTEELRAFVRSEGKIRPKDKGNGVSVASETLH
jgi:hypothetical protein